jgi:hypothetical protein
MIAALSCGCWTLSHGLLRLSGDRDTPERASPNLQPLSAIQPAAAKYVSFPLRVNQNGKSRAIHNAAELAAQWETIFTPPI